MALMGLLVSVLKWLLFRDAAKALAAVVGRTRTEWQSRHV
jgi:hypothetical protein